MRASWPASSLTPIERERVRRIAALHSCLLDHVSHFSKFPHSGPCRAFVLVLQCGGCGALPRPPYAVNVPRSPMPPTRLDGQEGRIGGPSLARLVLISGYASMHGVKGRDGKMHLLTNG